MPAYPGAPHLAKPLPEWAATDAEHVRREEASAMMRRVAESRTWGKGRKAATAPQEPVAGPHPRPWSRMPLEELTRTAKSLAALAAEHGWKALAGTDGRDVEVRVGVGFATVRGRWRDGRLLFLLLHDGLQYRVATLPAVKAALARGAAR